MSESNAFDKVRSLFFKYSKAATIKFEITSLEKKRDERIRHIGAKLVELINDGKIDKELFEPDYSMITSMVKEIELKNEELGEINNPTVQIAEEPEDNKNFTETDTSLQVKPETPIMKTTPSPESSIVVENEDHPETAVNDPSSMADSVAADTVAEEKSEPIEMPAAEEHEKLTTDLKDEDENKEK